jgi:hypothetical protein
MPVPTNQPFITAVESIQNAASGAGRWQRRENQPPAYARRTDKNTTVVEYGRDDERQVFEDRVIQNLWKDVREFSDRDADLLLYAFSSIIKETGSKGSAWIHAKQFLEQRGVKPMTKKEHGVTRRSGYRAEDLAAIEKSMYRLSGLWINIKEVFPPRKKGSKQRVYRHQGRMFAVMESWAQDTIETEDDAPERVPIAWKIKAGDWLMEYLSVPRYVAFLCDQSLKYDPYHEIWEKRLSRYFLFFLRINAKHHNGVLLRSIEELLQANSLPIDRVNPQKTRQRFERAMNRLLGDQQIDHWGYVPESMATLPARKWLDIWLQWSVRLSVKSRLDTPS